MAAHSLSNLNNWQRSLDPPSFPCNHGLRWRRGATSTTFLPLHTIVWLPSFHSSNDCCGSRAGSPPPLPYTLALIMVDQSRAEGRSKALPSIRADGRTDGGCENVCESVTTTTIGEGGGGLSHTLRGNKRLEEAEGVFIRSVPDRRAKGRTDPVKQGGERRGALSVSFSLFFSSSYASMRE